MIGPESRPLMTHLPREAEISISAAMKAMYDVATRICSEVGDQFAAEGSTARDWFGNTRLANTSLSPAYQQIAGGLDHFLAFVRLLRDDNDYGPSLAALTRANLEVIGIAWWLLDSAYAAQFESRVAELQLKYLRETVEFVESWEAGERLTPEQAIRGARQRASAAAVPGQRNTPPSYSDAVTIVMRALQSPDPEKEYRILSPLAHGNLHMIGGLGRHVDGQSGETQGVRIGLPIRNAEIYIWDLTHGLDAVIARLLDLVGLQAHRERWEATRDRSYTTIQGQLNIIRRAAGAELLG